jgi:hypothetical protein
MKVLCVDDKPRPDEDTSPVYVRFGKVYTALRVVHMCDKKDKSIPCYDLQEVTGPGYEQVDRFIEWGDGGMLVDKLLKEEEFAL